MIRLTGDRVVHGLKALLAAALIGAGTLTAGPDRAFADICGRKACACPLCGSGGGWGGTHDWGGGASVAKPKEDDEPAHVRRSMALGRRAAKKAARGGVDNLEEALRLYRKALQEDPSDTYRWLYLSVDYANYHLGLAYAEAGNLGAALPYLRAAAESNPLLFGKVLPYYRSLADQQALEQEGLDIVARASREPPDIVPDPSETRKERQREQRQAFAASLRGVAIGAAGAVTGEVSVQQPDGSWRQIEAGSVLRSHDLVRTGPDGRFQLLLMDETIFTAGPDTELILDEFVYDSSAEAGKFTSTIKKGVIRFVSGKVAARKPENMKIKVPGGTIGIRGTEFILEHDEQAGASTLYLHEGQIEITPTATGRARLFSARRMIRADASGIVDERRMSRRQWRRALEASRVGASE